MKIRLFGSNRRVKTHTLIDHEKNILAKALVTDELSDALVTFTANNLSLAGNYNVDCYFDRKDVIQLVSKLYGKRGLDNFIADYMKLGLQKRPKKV